MHANCHNHLSLYVVPLYKQSNSVTHVIIIASLALINILQVTSWNKVIL